MVSSARSGLSTAELVTVLRELRERIFEPSAPSLDAARQTYPYEHMVALREAGLLGVGIPEQYGGLGPAARVRANQLYREIARACGSTAQVFFVHVACVDSIFRYAGEELREFLAREVLERGAAVAVAAAELGRTIAERRASATRVDGGYVLNGLKAFCTGHEGAAYLAASVVAADASSPHEGGMNCLIAMDQPGVRVNRDWNNMGQRSTASGTVLLENVFVPDAMVINQPGSGVQIFNLRHLQSGFSAIFLGIAEGAFEKATDYVRTTTRPRPGIAEHAADDPLLQWHVGDLATQIEATRLLLEHVDELLVRHLDGDVSQTELLVAVFKLKVLATRTVLDVTSRIFQLMGARSTSAQHNFDRYWRDARTLTLHDPVDTRLQEIGRYLLVGVAPRELGEYGPLTSTP